MFDRIKDIKRIIQTIDVYTSSGYPKVSLIDSLCDELRQANHCEDVCSLDDIKLTEREQIDESK